MIIFQQTKSWKPILNEYAAKMNLDKFAYETVKNEGLPVFVSSLIFNVRRYHGDPAKNKREVEQLAVRAAILLNLGILCIYHILKIFSVT